MDFKKAQEKVERALALLDSETADEIIGQADEAYKALIQGMDGAHDMMFLMALTNGMKNTQKVRNMAGQGKLAMVTLVHYAYALGVKKGKETT